MVRCPKCNSHKFLYVQASIEYHSIESIDTESGGVYCNALEESFPMDNDEFEPYLKCDNCNTTFDCHLKEK